MIDAAPNPTAYAKSLARYISCPSTIRVRTLEYWGKAPSLEKCREMRARVANRAKGLPYALRAVQFSCPHPRTVENCHTLYDGTVECLQCAQEKVEADNAALAILRDKQAARAKLEAIRKARAERAAQRKTARARADEQRAAAALAKAEPLGPVYGCTIADLIDIAARLRGLSPDELRGNDNARRSPQYIARTRWCVWLAAREMGHSFPYIGLHTGGFDHSSVMYGVDQARYLIERDPALRRVVEALRTLVA